MVLETNGLAFCLDVRHQETKWAHLFCFLLTSLRDGKAFRICFIMRFYTFKVHHFVSRQGSSPVNFFIITPFGKLIYI